mmetsp:Transcript_27948/g.64503  ORF Transcript_27948/g.64503 Transcript_27948/m.64503 type:complete len:936 (-) Transcript_27948:33-2840(-)
MAAVTRSELHEELLVALQELRIELTGEGVPVTRAELEKALESNASSAKSITREELQEELALFAGTAVGHLSRQDLQNELRQVTAVTFTRDELKADLLQLSSSWGESSTAASRATLETRQALADLERKLQVFTQSTFQEEVAAALKKAQGTQVAHALGLPDAVSEDASPRSRRASRAINFAPQLEEQTIVEQVREVVREELQIFATKFGHSISVSRAEEKEAYKVRRGCSNEEAVSSANYSLPIVDVAWAGDEQAGSIPHSLKGQQSAPKQRSGGAAFPTLALQMWPQPRRDNSAESSAELHYSFPGAISHEVSAHTHVHWPIRTAVQHQEEEFSSQSPHGMMSNTKSTFVRKMSGLSTTSIPPPAFLERFRSGFKMFGQAELTRQSSQPEQLQIPHFSSHHITNAGALSPVQGSPGHSGSSNKGDEEAPVPGQIQLRQAANVPLPLGSPSAFSATDGTAGTGTGTDDASITSPKNGQRNSKKVSQSAGSASRNLSVLSRIQQKRQRSTSTADLAIARMLELEEEKTVKASLEKFIRSQYFDSFTLGLIMLNAISIGWQTDYLARANTDKIPLVARYVEVIFCVLFTLELLLKMYVFRLQFFRQDVRWNMFDTVVVLLQIVEEIMNLVANSISVNFSFLRIIRILRLIRVIRLIRILRLITDLRTLVTSLAGSIKAFGWTVILLFMLIYTVAIFFTQLVTDHRLGLNDEELARPSHLPQYFDSLGSTILALYQSILGGVSWREITSPLMSEISTSLGFVFCVYMIFCVLAMMNVVTGVFVDSALNSAKHDKEVYMMNSVRAMFLRKKMDLTGDMTYVEFQELLQSTEMMDYFKAIDVDISEAQSIFELLDVDSSGTLTAEEFITGCLRLQGTAKALDLTVLMTQVRDLGTFMFKILEDMDQRMGGCPEVAEMMRSCSSLHVNKFPTPKPHLGSRDL